MALISTAFNVDGLVYDLGVTPANYTGGTSLGDPGSARMLSIQHDVDLVKKQTRNTYSAVRIIGTGAAFEFIVWERSQKWMDWAFQQRAGTLDYTGVGTGYYRGHAIRAGDSQARCLMCRATDNTKPSLLIPAAICIDVAPVAWNRDGLHLQGAALTVIGLDDTRVGGPFFYGEPASWPTFSPSAPVIASITPDEGDVAGGETVVITGTNLHNAAVTFGGSQAGIVFNNGTVIVVTTPAHAAGQVNVVVTTPGGTDTEVNGYEYIEDIGT